MLSTYLRLLLIACIWISLHACVENQPTETSLETPNYITVEGKKFVDHMGRQVILNGINVVNKSKEDNYLFEAGPEFYADLRSWGFNCIRFIIIWDGLEPESGVFNEEYLLEIDKRIKWAADHGIFVVLDMHQDLFSVKYSDGAPDWATLDEDKPHQAGEIWSDAYMISQAVQSSFDNFWENKAAPDGIGVQDHYANLWKHIASRYRNNPAVIGYDIMNEPFPGSSALQGIAQFMAAYGALVYQLTGEVLTEEQVASAWSEENRAAALEYLNSKENYSQLVNAVQDFNLDFDKQRLMPMYQKISNAIREVDTNKVIFLEHSYYSNIGVSSGIERVSLADGEPDPKVAYAPHAYDLVTDTKDAASSEWKRVAFIYDRINQKAEQLNMPAWLGEWGAYYNHDVSIVPVAQHAVSLIEQYLFGNAYWSYYHGVENQEYFKQALYRPYPAYVNGALEYYRYHHESQRFSVSWTEGASKASTVIYFPDLSLLDSDYLKSHSLSVAPIVGSESGWVIVPADKPGERQLDFILTRQ